MADTIKRKHLQWENYWCRYIKYIKAYIFISKIIYLTIEFI